MFADGVSVRRQLDWLQAALGLGLDWDGQDWGIEHADASRVREFATFFEENYNHHWSPWTVEEFVDLVFESASDAITANAGFDVTCIDVFVNLAATVVPSRMKYWTSDDWAIAPHLRELGY